MGTIINLQVSTRTLYTRVNGLQRRRNIGGLVTKAMVVQLHAPSQAHHRNFQSRKVWWSLRLGGTADAKSDLPRLKKG